MHSLGRPPFGQQFNIPYVGDGSRFNVPSNPARSRASPVTSKCEIPSVGRRDLGEANVRPLAWGEVGFQPNVGKPGITAHHICGH